MQTAPVTDNWVSTTNHHVFRTTQFDIERWWCTSTVLSGSTRSVGMTLAVAFKPR